MNADDLSMSTAIIVSAVMGLAAGMLGGLILGSLWILRFGRSISRTMYEIHRESRGEWET